MWFSCATHHALSGLRFLCSRRPIRSATHDGNSSRPFQTDICLNRRPRTMATHNALSRRIEVAGKEQSARLASMVLTDFRNHRNIVVHGRPVHNSAFVQCRVELNPRMLMFVRLRHCTKPRDVMHDLLLLLIFESERFHWWAVFEQR